MKKDDFKIRLKSHCTAMLKEKMESLQSAMSEAQQSANEYGPPKDRYDSFRMQLLRKKELFAVQLQKALGEYSALENLNANKTMKIVDFGAIVITESQKLFISIGLGKVNFDGEIFFVVSPNVPLCLAMKGLKKGDQFTFNGKTSIINEII